MHPPQNSAVTAKWSIVGRCIPKQGPAIIGERHPVGDISTDNESGEAGKRKGFDNQIAEKQPYLGLGRECAGESLGGFLLCGDIVSQQRFISGKCFLIFPVRSGKLSR